MRRFKKTGLGPRYSAGFKRNPFAKITQEERSRIVELEIWFAKGWNSVTQSALPDWKHWKYKLTPSMTDEEAFNLGIEEYNIWESKCSELS